MANIIKYINTNSEKRFEPQWFGGANQTTPCGGSSPILVADDEASSRLGFRVALEAAGYAVSEAEDGEQALGASGATRFPSHSSISGCPDLMGWKYSDDSATRGSTFPLWSSPPTAASRVPSAARELGAVNFLSKPVQPTVLRQTVLDVLRRRPHVETESYRPTANSLGALAHRFTETLAVARRAWERGQVDLTEYLLQQALDLDPNSAAANALRGALQESLREYHAAYQSYRRALSRDRHHALALDGLKRYCERFGLDYQNAAINPAAE